MSGFVILVKLGTIASGPFDTGEKGYNYRSERFANRLKNDHRISKIFSSRIHRDRAGYPGDYLYRSGSLKWDVESGMWGIFRVKKNGIGCACKNLCRKIKGICCKGE